MKFNNAAKNRYGFERIKDQEAKVRVYTEVAVSVFNIIMLFTGLILFSLDKIDFAAF